MSDQEALNNNRQWQARIWIDSEKSEPPTALYGATIADLQAAVSAHIIQANPQKTVMVTDETYTYTDGSAFLPEYRQQKERRIRMGREPKLSEAGWHTDPYSNGHVIASIQALITVILKVPELVEKGPDYQNPTIVDGVLQLHMINRIKKSSQGWHADESLQRGWHLLQIIDGEYHLGHEDPDAL